MLFEKNDQKVNNKNKQILKLILLFIIFFHFKSWISYIYFIFLQFFVTTEPAPITTLSSTVTGNIVELLPISTLFLIFVFENFFQKFFYKIYRL